MAGFLAGCLSCLTPEALLLFPICLAAAGAGDRAAKVAVAIGLGLSVVTSGLLAPLFGHGFDTTRLRHIVCAVLLALGVCLMSARLAQRFSLFTGGVRSVFERPGEGRGAGGAVRQLLLAMLVGMNWIPRVDPALVKAALTAADTRDIGPALWILILFGIGAAIPWILVGRGIRFALRPVSGQTTDGIAGKQALGLSLLVVASLGWSGYDVALVRFLNPLLPSWAAKLAVAF